MFEKTFCEIKTQFIKAGLKKEKRIQLPSTSERHYQDVRLSNKKKGVKVFFKLE